MKKIVTVTFGTDDNELLYDALMNDKELNQGFDMDGRFVVTNYVTYLNKYKNKIVTDYTLETV